MFVLSRNLFMGRTSQCRVDRTELPSFEQMSCSCVFVLQHNPSDQIRLIVIMNDSKIRSKSIGRLTSTSARDVGRTAKPRPSALRTSGPQVHSRIPMRQLSYIISASISISPRPPIPFENNQLIKPTALPFGPPSLSLFLPK